MFQGRELTKCCRLIISRALPGHSEDISPKGLLEALCILGHKRNVCLLACIMFDTTPI